MLLSDNVSLEFKNLNSKIKNPLLLLPWNASSSNHLTQTSPSDWAPPSASETETSAWAAQAEHRTPSAGDEEANALPEDHHPDTPKQQRPPQPPQPRTEARDRGMRGQNGGSRGGRWGRRVAETACWQKGTLGRGRRDHVARRWGALEHHKEI